MRTSLIVDKHSPPFVWTKSFEKRGYWGFHATGMFFDRRKLSHWVIAVLHLWRTSRPTW